MSQSLDDYEPKPPALPREYLRSPFWNFFLDSKVANKVPGQPRFKQYAENLRNFAVSGAILKAARSMLLPPWPHGLFDRIGKYLLYAIGTTTTMMCCVQLFGLLVVGFHWYVGIPFDELYSEDKADIDRVGWKLTVMLFVPILFIWAMIAFVWN